MTAAPTFRFFVRGRTPIGLIKHVIHARHRDEAVEKFRRAHPESRDIRFFKL